MNERERQLQEEIKLLEAKEQLRYGLPYLYGYKFYNWSREFFESKNKQCFLVAGNQLGKSTSQIRKCIHWAINKEIWPELWSQEPNQFWYLYPSQEMINFEFKLKWLGLLPRGKYKDDPIYGWKELRDGRNTLGIQFNSGVHVIFKSYTKNVQHLQAGTCYAIWCDEELVDALYDELQMRLTATDGYFSMVFTATLGQEIWRKTMEPTEGEVENFPDAAKWHVSLYDSQHFEDGTPSQWTNERISQIKAKCKSHNEVLKRVYGRFVLTSGRKYPCFDASKHLKASHPIPHSWLVYSGVDIGSGGPSGHPSAIVFVAVRPDFQQGRIFMGWRGDSEITTSADVAMKYIELKERIKNPITSQYYDWANKDFEITASRLGLAFQKADKSHEKGEGILNTLFKNDMLLIYETDQTCKLAQELATLNENTNKKKARDDFIDALRYATSSIPWDFSFITDPQEFDDSPEKPLTSQELEFQARRGMANDEQTESIDDEFEYWNSYY